MQRTHSTLSRRLSHLVLVAAVFPGALALGAASVKAAAETPLPDLIDDSVTATGEDYAIMCNTCSTTSDFINKAKTTYPRVRDSRAFVYNLSRGEVRGIALEWDPETQSQIGGYEIETHAHLRTYVQQAGELYRRNNNSLGFKLIARGDGSVYWKTNAGATVELRLAGVGRTPTGRPPGSEAHGGSSVNADTMPGVNSPIDTRGYVFSSNFRDVHPNFPATSYDLGFGLPGSINNFVRDQVSTLPNGGVAGIFNGTVQSSIGGAAPLNLVQGGQQITKQIQSQVTVIVPMKDGGFAIVRYDPVTAEVILKEVQDSQGLQLPLGNGNPAAYFANRQFNFSGTPRGEQGLNALQDWANRNGIPITDMSGAGSGGSVRCSSRGPNEIECTIMPR